MELSVLQNINKLGACDFSVEKLSQLEPYQPYKVVSIKAVNTCFGRRVVVSLENIEGHVYLPERFKALTEEEIESLRSIPKLNLVYKGKKILANGRSANDVEFITL